MKHKIISIIIFILGLGLLIFCIINNHLIWLKEYNKQIEQFGFYKEDIKILNQEIIIILNSTGMITSICMILSSLVLFII